MNRLILLVAGVLVGGALAFAWQRREHDKDLARAAEALGVASDSLGQVSARLTSALTTDSLQAVRVDSLSRTIARLRATRRPIPAVPTDVPDTCRPWFDRSTALGFALLDAEMLIDTLTLRDSLQSNRITLLRGEITSSALRTASLAADLERERARIPLTRPATSGGLLLLGEMRAEAGQPVEMTVALGSRVMSGVDLFVGARQDVAGGDRRMVGGGRISIRLR